jgi:hypothetical protein
LEDELEFHFQQEFEHQMARGLSVEDASVAARRRLGGVQQIKESYRDARGIRWVEAFFRDLQYGLRALHKSRRIPTRNRTSSFTKIRHSTPLP